jgi:PadR family transcriptional regulator PadR
MNDDNIKSQLKKGLLEFFILQIMSRDKVYAPEIIQKLSEAEMLVVEGTLYPLLSRLRRDGLVKYEWVESLSGPPRKYYSLTDLGVEKLKLFKSSWEEVNKSYLTLFKN